MFNLVSAQECRHEDEVEEKEWPVDGDISWLEATEEAGYAGGGHHFLPKLQLVEFALEALIFVLLAVRQYRFVLIGVEFEVVGVVGRRQV